LAVVVLVIIAKTNIVKSRVGRALLAIRENAHAADGMGVNVRKYKIIAFAVSAFFVALAGSLFAHIAGWISPDGFNDTQSVLFVTMMLLGGSGSKWGPVIGAIVVIVLQEQLRPLANVAVLIYGGILLFVIWLMPGGIVGTVQRFTSWIRKTIKNRVKTTNEIGGE
jgi:branched-chain amino acid transport system permease protein